MSAFMNRVRRLLASTAVLIAPAIAAAPTLASPDPATLLPADVAYTIRLDMREETWAQLNQYVLFQQLQAQTEGLSRIGGLPYLSTLGLEYDTFIAPWVADTTAIALLPVENANAATAIAEREILIAPIAHPETFAEQFDGKLIGLIGALKQQAPQTVTYQGVEISYWEPLFFEDIPEGSASPEAPASPIAPSPVPPRPATPPSRLPSLDREITPEESLKAMPESHAEMGASPKRWPDVPGLAIAVFPDFLIVADNPAAIRAWVDLRPGEGMPALADDEAFQRLLTHPHYDEAFGALYGNFAELMKYPLTDFPLPELPFNLPLPLPGAIALPDPAQLTSQSLDITLEVLIYPQAQGLRLQGRGYYDNALLGDLPTISAASTATLSYIPQDSYGMISGQNLAGIWRQVTTTFAATPNTRALLEQVSGFFAAFTGLDLDRDVFGWMDQGFSIFLYPTDQTPLTAIAPELRVGLGIALQTSDRATATATLATFDELMEEFSITVESTTLNGQAATSWSDSALAGDDSASFLGRTWVDEDTLLLTTHIDALANLTQLDPAQTLPNSLRFIASTEDFPTANQGYLYANTAPMRSLFYSLFPLGPDPAESLEFRQLIASVQALSGTISFQDEYAQIDGMLLLAPAETP